MSKKAESKQPDPIESFFDSSPEESERYQILKTFYEELGIEMKTDLKNREIDAIVKTEYFQDILETEFGLKMELKDLTKQYKTHLVSRDRKGRDEAMRVLASEADKQKTLMQKILGEK